MDKTKFDELESGLMEAFSFAKSIVGDDGYSSERRVAAVEAAALAAQSLIELDKRRPGKSSISAPTQA